MHGTLSRNMRAYIHCQIMQVYGALCKTLCKVECCLRYIRMESGMISKSTWICISYGKVHTFTIGSHMQPCFISGCDLLFSCDVHASRWHMGCSRSSACHGISRKLCHGAWFSTILFFHVVINSVLIKSQCP